MKGKTVGSEVIGGGDCSDGSESGDVEMGGMETVAQRGSGVEGTRATDMTLRHDASRSNCDFGNHENFGGRAKQQISHNYESRKQVDGAEIDKMDRGDSLTVRAEINNNNNQKRSAFGNSESNHSFMPTISSVNSSSSQAEQSTNPQRSFGNRRVRFTPYVHPTTKRRLQQPLQEGLCTHIQHQHVPIWTKQNIQQGLQGTQTSAHQNQTQSMIHNQFQDLNQNEVLSLNANQARNRTHFLPPDLKQTYDTYDPVLHAGNQNVPKSSRVNALEDQLRGSTANEPLRSKPALQGNVTNTGNNFVSPLQPSVRSTVIQENEIPHFAHSRSANTPSVTSVLAASALRNGIRSLRSVSAQQSTRFMTASPSFPVPTQTSARSNPNTAPDCQSANITLQFVCPFGKVVTIPGSGSSKTDPTNIRSSTDGESLSRGPRSEFMAPSSFDDGVPRVSLDLTVAHSGRPCDVPSSFAATTLSDRSRLRSSEGSGVLPDSTPASRPRRCSDGDSQLTQRTVPLGLNSPNPLLPRANGSGIDTGQMAALLRLPWTERMRLMQSSLKSSGTAQTAMGNCAVDLSARISTANNPLQPAEQSNQNDQYIALYEPQENELDETDEDDEDVVGNCNDDDNDDGDNVDDSAPEDERVSENEENVCEEFPLEEELESGYSGNEATEEPMQNLESAGESDSHDLSYYYVARNLRRRESASTAPTPSASALNRPSTSSSSLNTSFVEETDSELHFGGPARRRRNRNRKSALVARSHDQPTGRSSGNQQVIPQSHVFPALEVSQNNSLEEVSVLGMLPAGYRESDDMLFAQRQMEAALDLETLLTAEEQEWMDTHHPPPYPLPLPVEIHPRALPYLTSNSSLLAALECPVSFVYMIKGMPILLCVNGHNVCSYCQRRVHMCPICRGRLLVTRNLALEAIAADVVFHLPANGHNQPSQGHRDSNQASQNSTQEHRGNIENAENQDSFSE